MSSRIKPEKPASHLVPDVLPKHADVVFCGTALGHESWRQRAYYAHPGNLFWRTLHAVGLTPTRIAPRDYLQAKKHGIGLTDLCKFVYGNDDELPLDSFDRSRLEKEILKARPKILAFTSKTAASKFLQKPVGKIPYGFQEECVGKTRIFVLCSPSGQARRFWRQELWQELAGAARDIKPV